MRLHRAATWVVACAALAAVGGCSARVGRGPSLSDAPGGALVGNQGGSWEVVLPGGSTGPRLAVGPEASRRDAMLADAPQSLIEESYWPEASGPRLDRLRRIWLTGEPEHLYFYRPGPAWPYAHPHRYRGW